MEDSSKVIKRIFDLVLSLFLLLVFWWVIIILMIIATIDTGEIRLFSQNRIGKNALFFKIFKIRTMKKYVLIKNNDVIISKDKRITNLGKFLRKTKLDELPQLINVLIGNMSFVGPRPDVAGFADQLQGEDRVVLSIKPGITGPASIYFRNEESILGEQKNPKMYNMEIIWPKKVQINKEYIKTHSFRKDCCYLVQTLFKI